MEAAFFAPELPLEDHVPTLRQEPPRAAMSLAAAAVLATLAPMMPVCPRRRRPVQCLRGFSVALCRAMAARPDLPADAFVAAGRHATTIRHLPTSGAFAQFVLDLARIHAVTVGLSEA